MAQQAAAEDRGTMLRALKQRSCYQFLPPDLESCRIDGICRRNRYKLILAFTMIRRFQAVP